MARRCAASFATISEMIIAMVVGMVVLGAAEAMLLDRVGWAGTRLPDLRSMC